MATHLTARLAWHMDGWNGRICSNPGDNCFCIGPNSYPGDDIRKKRNLNLELLNAGRSCTELTEMPPCVYSVNAFGPDPITAEDTPPEFFGSGKPTAWIIPPATVCVWPYEAMYDDDARTNGKYDNDKRLQLAKTYFSHIEPGKSLVFHYANYSNPISTEDSRKYLLVGISRVKRFGQIEFYKDTNDQTRRQFGGGFIWQMNVETMYPDEGLCIPYHKYLDKPEILREISVLPENPRTCKYGTRHVSDDGALSLVERFIEVVSYLQDLGDTTENWSVRLDWLRGLLAELWRSRGLYPGMGRILNFLGIQAAVQPLRAAIAEGEEKEFCAQIFEWLNNRADLPSTVSMTSIEADRARRKWAVKPLEETQLIQEVLLRIDLTKEQMEKVLREERFENGIRASLSEICENPYLLCEQFVGDDADDLIPFSCIDHAMLPSPELGGEMLAEPDDWRRLRALCVNRLRFETKHTFLSASQLLIDVNKRMEVLPQWKRATFSKNYLSLDREKLGEVLTLREHDSTLFVYLKDVYAAEREVEARLRALVSRPDISFKSPMTSEHWKNLLFNQGSELALGSEREYLSAIADQSAACGRVFCRPLSIISGSAGTGKTTVIKAILGAIDKAHGESASFLLLAPTGKAADRMRERTGKTASTIHSFLAKLGWINENLTIKVEGGRKEGSITTFVIDEASMMHLELMAALCKAINWNSVQRFIIVGDPNQLPPIGRGRVFADTILWLKKHHPESVAELTVNLRQMENRTNGRGTGILDLASLYIQPDSREFKNEIAGLRAEDMFQRLQDLPPDGAVDNDLRVVFWSDAADLKSKLTSQLISDMEADTESANDAEKPGELWNLAAKGNAQFPRPEYNQIISPYLHDDFGTNALNLHIQSFLRGSRNQNTLDGICLFDKVIQIKNRTGQSSLVAYNFASKMNEAAEVFNGELGFVTSHGLDKNRWYFSNFRPQRFQVRFSRKENMLFSYGRELGTYTAFGKQKAIPNQAPEENLELAYAISVHKSQGSEFERVYFVLPREKAALLSPELFYTGITRASRHCTLLIEKDIQPLLRMHRPEASHLLGINSSLFEFVPAPEGFETLRRVGYLEQYRIHRTLAEVMVRSKSEVIIANILFDRNIEFEYEKLLYAPDGTCYLPDFSILWNGVTFYWEHLGLLSDPTYQTKWEQKLDWYKKHFPKQLIVTVEGSDLSIDALNVVNEYFAGS